VRIHVALGYIQTLVVDDESEQVMGGSGDGTGRAGGSSIWRSGDGDLGKQQSKKKEEKKRKTKTTQNRGLNGVEQCGWAR
jgi:hypothetical protein